MFLPEKIENDHFIANKEYSYVFLNTSGINIKSVAASCGCTTPKVINDAIHVTFIPALKADYIAADHYITTKSIDVLFENNTVFTITITGKVYNE